MATAVLMMGGNLAKGQGTTVNIQKNNIKLQSDLMTPEALWAMGRISTGR